MYTQTIVVGNLGRDPELKYTSQGDAVTSFSVATSRKWKGGDGQPVEETTWFRVSVWGKQAEPCNQYLNKGSLVMVVGRLTPDRATGGPRVWTDNEGNARASFELRAFDVKFLGSSGQGSSEQGDSGRPVQAGPSTGDAVAKVAEDEIPF